MATHVKYNKASRGGAAKQRYAAFRRCAAWTSFYGKALMPKTLYTKSLYAFSIFVRMKNKWTRIFVVLGIIAANIGLDQWTKIWARNTLQFRPMESYWDDFFRLIYVENKGAFLSLGSDLSDWMRTLILHFFPAILLAALTFYAMLSKSLNKWQIIGMSFIIGGGISNVYDRIIYSAVTDFMNMGLFGLRTGIFNFADVSIMVGLGIMLPFAFQKEKEEEEEKEETKVTE
jgi:signal peptidase II